MADPRFFKNCGPFSLAQICERSGIVVPAQADPDVEVSDLASLAGAGPAHLSYFLGAPYLKQAFLGSRAGFCLVPQGYAKNPLPAFAPARMILLEAASVTHAFAAIASLFYPQNSQPVWPQQDRISKDAVIERDVILAPGVVIGPGAEIGEGTHIGPDCVIGPGVAIGRNCELGAHTSISHAYLGDRLLILPGAHIGQPGFSFASSASGHVKIPQLGRVIIQDDVEIGASTTIDRGSLADTVIGEGSKLDNLIMVAHNVHIGRHCVIAAQTGIAGSCIIEDFVILGGQVGLGDHTKIGSGARLGARSATISGTELAGGKDYGGVPAKPLREWIREIHTVSRLARQRKRDENG